MCKGLGGGARCRLRKEAANQITALRYIPEAVWVKSFERATTELRADLDTPAHAEALKTTERKLQIAEQRVATLEASLTRQQNLRMQGDQQRIVIEYQFSASLHEREFVLGSTHVVVYRGLDMCTAMRRGMRRTRQCRVLYFEVRGDFNAADRAANAPVYAPFTLRVRCQEGRPAPSTLEKLPEHGLRHGVVHARVEPERWATFECNDSDVRVAPRKNEVKQQQDWRLVLLTDQKLTKSLTAGRWL